MRYFIGTWDHDLPDDPIWMAYEVDAERNVLRMIERFPSELAEYREAALEGWPSLIDQSFPEPDEVPADDPTLALVEVTAKEFEDHWREDLKVPKRLP
jgi:hypothetical protein